MAGGRALRVLAAACAVAGSALLGGRGLRRRATLPPLMRRSPAPPPYANGDPWYPLTVPGQQSQISAAAADPTAGTGSTRGDSASAGSTAGPAESGAVLDSGSTGPGAVLSTGATARATDSAGLGAGSAAVSGTGSAALGTGSAGGSGPWFRFVRSGARPRLRFGWSRRGARHRFGGRQLGRDGHRIGGARHRIGCAGTGSAGLGTGSAVVGGTGSAALGIGSAVVGGTGSAAVGSAGIGSAGVGSAGVGSAATGSAGIGSAGVGSAATGSAGIGSAGVGSAATGSAATGSAATGSAARGSAAVGSAARSAPGNPAWAWPAWALSRLLIALGAVWIVMELGCAPGCRCAGSGRCTKSWSTASPKWWRTNRVDSPRSSKLPTKWRSSSTRCTCSPAGLVLAELAPPQASVPDRPIGSRGGRTIPRGSSRWIAPPEALVLGAGFRPSCAPIGPPGL